MLCMCRVKGFIPDIITGCHIQKREQLGHDFLCERPDIVRTLLGLLNFSLVTILTEKCVLGQDIQTNEPCTDNDKEVCLETNFKDLFAPLPYPTPFCHLIPIGVTSCSLS